MRQKIERTLWVHLGDAVALLFGMWGLTHTIRRTFGWSLRLMLGRVTRHTSVPSSRIPMRGADSPQASHAMPGTPKSPGRNVA